MSEHNHTGLDEAASVASNTMQAVRTGKAISAAAKGAAAGGPYSCTDIAKLYQKKPNYIGACISRAAEKLRRERIVREFYTACTEQDIKSA